MLVLVGGLAMTAGTYPEGGCRHGINKICVDVLLLAQLLGVVERQI